MIDACLDRTCSSTVRFYFYQYLISSGAVDMVVWNVEGSIVLNVVTSWILFRF
jgi:hypothetical protein